MYMSDLNSNISNLLFLCPLCGGFTFSQHTMAEYAREWNKCPSCGYMEEKTVSINRILNRLAPDKLVEPFIDPITPKILKKVRSSTIGRTNKHNKNKSRSNIDCPNCEQRDNNTPDHN